jgi:hypothetical protein
MFAEFQVGQVLWSMMWFFIFFIWIMLLFQVFADLFRSHDLSGFSKVIWILVILILPYLGVFIYLIARGSKMAEHNMAAAQEADAQFRQYVQESAGSSSAADEIARLAQLHKDGTLSDEEFAKAKAKVVS